MSIDSSLRTLAALVEGQRSSGVDVESVSATTEGDEMTTTMRVAFPFDPATDAVTVDVADAEYRDGAVAVDVSMTFDTAELSAGESPLDDPITAAADDDSAAETTTESDAGGAPAYKDPERLREVYETHDSFAAMTEALGVDVTAQTVRRNMMKHGIHEPATSGDSSAAAEAEADDEASEAAEANSEGVGESAADEPDVESEPAPTDATDVETAESTPASGGSAESAPETATAEAGAAPAESDSGEPESLESAAVEAPEFGDVDLPDGVTPEAVRDAVAESSSLHGVQSALGLEMRDTRALLKDLGLLTYVTGRLADRSEKPDPSEIEQQIYDSLTAHADGGRDPA